MNTMPRFTAEASLYISRKLYAVTAIKFLATKPDIQPQVRRWPPGDCDPGCVCFSPINCPCCKSLWPLPWPEPNDEHIFRGGQNLSGLALSPPSMARQPGNLGKTLR